MIEALRLAASQVGLNERDQNAALQDYMTTGGVNLDPAVTAWCAAFVNATLQQSGVEGTGSNMARSFLDWGQGVDVGQAQPGDIAVFSRGDPNGPYGHVGFIEEIRPDGSIRVLGGNQGDAVGEGIYSQENLLGVRRAPGEQQPQYAGEPQNALGWQPQFTPTEAIKSRRLNPLAMIDMNQFVRQA